MSTATLKPSFATGELAPTLFGHVDLARIGSAATTMRNMFVRYTGGAISRAGTAFVNFSKQTGRQYPPRLMTFQFNINQGLVLEFGHQYMRVIYQGALVTEPPVALTAATKASPCVITAASSGALTGSPSNAGVISSYAPGDVLTLAGGTYSVPASFTVQKTTLLSITPTQGVGSGYVPGDTITLAGGTNTTAAVATVSTTAVASATVAAAGTGGTAGTYNVTGTTGTGTKFQANVTVSGGGITAVNSITTPGAYTVNPTSLAAEPVTGGGLTGATLALAMGVGTAAVTTGGAYTANPGGGLMSQAATSGAGTGATFAYALFGPGVLVLAAAGSYSALPASPAATTGGSGSGAQINLTTGTSTTWNAGDWIYISGVGGMTQLNGRTVVLGAPTGNNYPIYDVHGNPIDSTLFGTLTSSGQAARVYTLATPWQEQDLEYLKISQSADVVSICCVNQATGTEYPSYDLTRLADDSFTLTQLVLQQTVQPPASVTLKSTGSAANSAYASYSYQVTSVNPDDGSESIASPAGQLLNTVDIGATAGSITINWPAVGGGVTQYNVYKATPGFSNSANAPAPPVGAQYGYLGTTFGTSFLDSNITADFAQVPPTHNDPFARGSVLGATVTNAGSNYTTASATITSATGSGAVIQPIIVNGQIVAFLVQSSGRNYQATDTITITGTGGTGATAKILVGAQSGTYPGVVGYYQERRVYGYTNNNPDTYFMSQPGAFLNFDYRIPTVDSDAITGTPWSQQVNGVQFFVSMPGGLVVLTGLGAWQLTGAGGSSLNPTSLTPSSQQAQPQAYNGCSPTVPPVKIDYDILYVQAKGSIYRDLAYQFFTNIYTGTDLTVNSSHLFFGHTIREHAYCEEPYKVLWSVRDDGVLLSLTYLKAQEIAGWARHDTQGLFQSVCSVVEPPVDALYCAVQRFLPSGTAYTLERMDDRLWSKVEDVWAVDCGLALPLATPNASLSITGAPGGLGSLTGVTALVPGQNYSAGTTAVIVDDNGQGPGAGAAATVSVVSGQIVGVNFTSAGSGYVNPRIDFVDPTGAGTGASATVILNTNATFTASSAIFSLGSVGEVIRMGGGIGTITGYTSSTVVTAEVNVPITALIPGTATAVTAPAGSWTIATPTNSISGLYHLAGATVIGLADGNPIPPTTVSASGTLALPAAASAVVVGLPFQSQFQTFNVDAGEPTVQGQRKKVAKATVRVSNSRGIKVGSNQVNGSTLSPPIIAPIWSNLDTPDDLTPPPYNAFAKPLYTGDVRVSVSGGFAKAGQVACQQDYALPMEILAVMPEVLAGDLPEQRVTPRQHFSQGGEPPPRQQQKG